MVERLSEEERILIKENWDFIKENALKSILSEINIEQWTINFQKIMDDIQLTITKKGKEGVKICISKKAKVMKFKYRLRKRFDEKDELIYQSDSIMHFVQLYKMEHPIYKIKQDDEYLEKSVTEEKVDEIFENEDITEIIDDRFDKYVSQTEFLQYKNKKISEFSDFYDYFSKSKYSNLYNIITKKSKEKILESQERKSLIDFLKKINMIENQIIVIAGAQNIGLSFSILSFVECYSILYIDLNILFQSTNSKKRKYIFLRFINLFRDYTKYYKFITNNILPIQGYDDILSIIEKIIILISEKLKGINIIIDNYDDNLVGEKKLSSDYIDNIYSKIKNENIKIIFLGRGLFISNLLIRFFYDKTNIKKFILVKYYPTLGLGIENIIHSYYKENKINEIELYYNKGKNINMEYLIYNLIIIKNMKKIIGKDYHQEIPFQFFRFVLDKNNEIKIEYQFEDLIDLNNIKLREYMAKLSNVVHFLDNATPSVKGFIFEELVVSNLMNNKTNFRNLNFSLNNIIEVDSIYNLKNVKPVKNLVGGDVLIIQKQNGEVFDFGIIKEFNNINYFIGGQIGLNKTLENIKTYVKKIIENEKCIIKSLNDLSQRNITQLKFIIILSKEKQKSLEKEYNDIEEHKNKLKEKGQKLTELEKYNLDKMKRKLNHFNTEYGIKCCHNEKVSYLLFSSEDLCFYKNVEKINSFDIDKIKFLKTGLEAFCDNEYKLCPYKSSEPILNIEEKSNLLKKLNEELSSDIKDIKIENIIIGNINLLPATPENFGILSIYNNNKVFSYFDDKYIHFIINNNNVNKFYHSEKIFIEKFKNDESLERYFVEFIYDKKDEIEIEEENKFDVDKKSSGKEKKIKKGKRKRKRKRN